MILVWITPFPGSPGVIETCRPPGLKTAALGAAFWVDDCAWPCAGRASPYTIGRAMDNTPATLSNSFLLKFSLLATFFVMM